MLFVGAVRRHLDSLERWPAPRERIPGRLVQGHVARGDDRRRRRNEADEEVALCRADINLRVTSREEGSTRVDGDEAKEGWRESESERACVQGFSDSVRLCAEECVQRRFFREERRNEEEEVGRDGARERELRGIRLT